MRNLFRQPKPRRFTHRYQYIDEREERLRLIREEAQKGKETSPDSADARQRLAEALATARQQRQQRRKRTVAAAWLWGALASAGAALALVLLYLAT